MQAESGFDETAVLEQTYQETQQYFSSVEDLAHGWEHVKRVYQLALMIAEKEKAERFVVGMAALLHDLGHALPHTPGVSSSSAEGQEHHADISARSARALMTRYGVPEEQQEAITHAIVAHSFSKGAEPRTLEARIVRDADRLDALGAIGIMRWAATGAVRFSQKRLSYHPDDPFGKHHQLDDIRYALDHFALKLLKLQETILTPTGYALAQRRTAFMHAYLDEFRNELEID